MESEDLRNGTKSADKSKDVLRLDLRLSKPLMIGLFELRGTMISIISPSTWKTDICDKYMCKLFSVDGKLVMLVDQHHTIILDDDDPKNTVKDIRIYPDTSTASHIFSGCMLSIYSSSSCLHIRTPYETACSSWIKAMGNIKNELSHIQPNCCIRTVSTSKLDSITRDRSPESFAYVDKRMNLDDDYVSLKLFDCLCCGLKYSFLLNETKMLRSDKFPYPLNQQLHTTQEKAQSMYEEQRVDCIIHPDISLLENKSSGTSSKQRVSRLCDCISYAIMVALLILCLMNISSLNLVPSTLLQEKYASSANEITASSLLNSFPRGSTPHSPLADGNTDLTEGLSRASESDHSGSVKEAVFDLIYPERRNEASSLTDKTSTISASHNIPDSSIQGEHSCAEIASDSLKVNLGLQPIASSEGLGSSGSKVKNEKEESVSSHSSVPEGDKSVLGSFFSTFRRKTVSLPKSTIRSETSTDTPSQYKDSPITTNVEEKVVNSRASASPVYEISSNSAKFTRDNAASTDHAALSEAATSKGLSRASVSDPSGSVKEAVFDLIYPERRNEASSSTDETSTISASHNIPDSSIQGEHSGSEIASDSLKVNLGLQLIASSEGIGSSSSKVKNEQEESVSSHSSVPEGEQNSVLGSFFSTFRRKAVSPPKSTIRSETSTDTPSQYEDSPITKDVEEKIVNDRSSASPVYEISSASVRFTRDNAASTDHATLSEAATSKGLSRASVSDPSGSVKEAVFDLIYPERRNEASSSTDETSTISASHNIPDSSIQGEHSGVDIAPDSLKVNLGLQPIASSEGIGSFSSKVKNEQEESVSSHSSVPEGEQNSVLGSFFSTFRRKTVSPPKSTIRSETSTDTPSQYKDSPITKDVEEKIVNDRSSASPVYEKSSATVRFTRDNAASTATLSEAATSKGLSRASESDPSGSVKEAVFDLISHEASSSTDKTSTISASHNIPDSSIQGEHSGSEIASDSLKINLGLQPIASSEGLGSSGSMVKNEHEERVSSHSSVPEGEQNSVLGSFFSTFRRKTVSPSKSTIRSKTSTDTHSQYKDSPITKDVEEKIVNDRASASPVYEISSASAKFTLDNAASTDHAALSEAATSKGLSRASESDPSGSVKEAVFDLIYPERRNEASSSIDETSTISASHNIPDSSIQGEHSGSEIASDLLKVNLGLQPIASSEGLGSTGSMVKNEHEESVSSHSSVPEGEQNSVLGSFFSTFRRKTVSPPKSTIRSETSTDTPSQYKDSPITKDVEEKIVNDRSSASPVYEISSASAKFTRDKAASTDHAALSEAATSKGLSRASVSDPSGSVKEAVFDLISPERRNEASSSTDETSTISASHNIPDSSIQGEHSGTEIASDSLKVNLGLQPIASSEGIGSSGSKVKNEQEESVSNHSSVPEGEQNSVLGSFFFTFNRKTLSPPKSTIQSETSTDTHSQYEDSPITKDVEEKIVNDRSSASPVYEISSNSAKFTRDKAASTDHAALSEAATSKGLSRASESDPSGSVKEAVFDLISHEASSSTDETSTISASQDIPDSSIQGEHSGSEIASDSLEVNLGLQPIASSEGLGSSGSMVKNEHEESVSSQSSVPEGEKNSVLGSFFSTFRRKTVSPPKSTIRSETSTDTHSQYKDSPITKDVEEKIVNDRSSASPVYEISSATVRFTRDKAASTDHAALSEAATSKGLSRASESDPSGSVKEAVFDLIYPERRNEAASSTDETSTISASHNIPDSSIQGEHSGSEIASDLLKVNLGLQPIASSEGIGSSGSKVKNEQEERVSSHSSVPEGEQNSVLGSFFFTFRQKTVSPPKSTIRSETLSATSSQYEGKLITKDVEEKVVNDRASIAPVNDISYASVKFSRDNAASTDHATLSEAATSKGLSRASESDPSGSVKEAVFDLIYPERRNEASSSTDETSTISASHNIPDSSIQGEHSDADTQSASHFASPENTQSALATGLDLKDLTHQSTHDENATETSMLFDSSRFFLNPTYKSSKTINSTNQSHSPHYMAGESTDELISDKNKSPMRKGTQFNHIMQFIISPFKKYSLVDRGSDMDTNNGLSGSTDSTPTKSPVVDSNIDNSVLNKMLPIVKSDSTSQSNSTRIVVQPTANHISYRTVPIIGKCILPIRKASELFTKAVKFLLVVHSDPLNEGATDSDAVMFSSSNEAASNKLLTFKADYLLQSNKNETQKSTSMPYYLRAVYAANNHIFEPTFHFLNRSGGNIMLLASIANSIVGRLSSSASTGVFCFVSKSLRLISASGNYTGFAFCKFSADLIIALNRRRLAKRDWLYGFSRSIFLTAVGVIHDVNLRAQVVQYKSRQRKRSSSESIFLGIELTLKTASAAVSEVRRISSSALHAVFQSILAACYAVKIAIAGAATEVEVATMDSAVKVKSVADNIVRSAQEVGQDALRVGVLTVKEAIDGGVILLAPAAEQIRSATERVAQSVNSGEAGSKILHAAVVATTFMDKEHQELLGISKI